MIDADIDFNKKICILGIGNRMRGDDGFGSVLAAELSSSLGQSGNYLIIDSGTVPENYIGRIIKFDPGVVVVVDAIKFDAGPPGGFEFADYRMLSEDSQSTHGISVKMISETLKSEMGAEIFVLAVKAVNFELSETLSGELIKLKNEFMKYFKEGLCTS